MAEANWMKLLLPSAPGDGFCVLENQLSPAKEEAPLVLACSGASRGNKGIRLAGWV
jgi:hypothetical protein